MGAKAKRNRLSMALTPHAKHASFALRPAVASAGALRAHFNPAQTYSSQLSFCKIIWRSFFLCNCDGAGLQVVLHRFIPHIYHFAKKYGVLFFS